MCIGSEYQIIESHYLWYETCFLGYNSGRDFQSKKKCGTILDEKMDKSKIGS